jgi:hypothetical protein
LLYKCANEACSVPFRRLREGKLFQVETEYFAGRASPPTSSRRTCTRRVEHYWLCDACSPYVTLTLDVVTVPLHDGLGKKTVRVLTMEPDGNLRRGEAKGKGLVYSYGESLDGRLRVLSWNETVAFSTEAHLACGAAHVQQLVVHWMTMGTLEYSFAKALSSSTSRRFRRTRQPHEPEAETRGSSLVGELAVPRESLERILRENPESLAAILEALTSALTNAGGRSVRVQEEIDDSTEVCALREA